MRVLLVMASALVCGACSIVLRLDVTRAEQTTSVPPMVSASRLTDVMADYRLQLDVECMAGTLTAKACQEQRDLILEVEQADAHDARVHVKVLGRHVDRHATPPARMRLWRVLQRAR